MERGSENPAVTVEIAVEPGSIAATVPPVATAKGVAARECAQAERPASPDTVTPGSRRSTPVRPSGMFPANPSLAASP